MSPLDRIHDRAAIWSAVETTLEMFWRFYDGIDRVYGTAARAA